MPRGPEVAGCDRPQHRLGTPVGRRLGNPFDGKGKAQAERRQRAAVGDRRRLDPRQGAQLVEQVAVAAGDRCVRVAMGGAHLDHQHRADVEPAVGGLQALGAGGEQAGEHEQHRGQRDLCAHQAAAEAGSQVAGRRPAGDRSSTNGAGDGCGEREEDADQDGPSQHGDHHPPVQRGVDHHRQVIGIPGQKGTQGRPGRGPTPDRRRAERRPGTR